MPTTLAQPETRETPVAYARGVSRPPFASGRFYWCVGILLVSAASMQVVAKWFEATFRKEPLPLKRHLYELDAMQLAPEYRQYERQPKPIDQEELENLGTEEYLNWTLVDESKKPDDPTRLAHLFITYYTGKPDLVPHEPRECWRAAGQTLVGEHAMNAKVERREGSPADINIAVLDFEEPPRSDVFAGDPRRTTVLFFFWANGRYVTTRNDVRLSVANLRHRYAYYTKLEISFSDELSQRLADRETSMKAGATLLQKLMPVLWRDHYQDWDAILAGKPPVKPVP